ncbi:MAG: NADP-dependent oxidoreductase [Pseudonocardiales bacterium]|nr:NADP-dependent oxidoreductase [Pseudonocardiales bacterium]
MRAVRFHRVGGPEVLRVDDVPDPGAPTGDEVLVRVEASSVNGTDLGLRRGDLRVATLGRLPFTPGFDVAGEVLACGPGVTAFAPGDRVVALIGHGGGGQVERIRIRQGRAALAPRSVPATDAAALPLAGLTALQGLGRAGLAARPRARVLVHGATGGIGTFAVQLAVLAGAHVTAVASAARLDLATELGAHEVLDRRRHDVTALGARFDVVLDAAGTLPFVPGLLTGDGVQVSVRPLSPDVLRAALRVRRRGPRFTAVRTAPRSQDLAHLAALVDAGRLRAVVDAVHPMADAAGAHRHAEAGVRGKVVLDLR